MLLDLWFHHTFNRNAQGMYFSPRNKINRKRENDEALLMLLGLL